MMNPREERTEPAPLGPPLRSEAPVQEWRPVHGRPHFWVNAKGQIKYEPPTPALTMRSDIEMVCSDFVVRHLGPEQFAIVPP